MNMMIPNGELNVSGLTGNGIMTGWYIVERLTSLGNNITWNKYDCSQPASLQQPFVSSRVQQTNVPVVVTTPPAEVKGQDDIFKVNAYPNPSAYDFTIQVISKSNEPITIRILDINGKVRSVQTQLSKTSSIKVGSGLLGGTYIAEVIQGTNRQTIKLVKLN
jgi:hypothetical protein